MHKNEKTQTMSETKDMPALLLRRLPGQHICIDVLIHSAGRGHPIIYDAAVGDGTIRPAYYGVYQ